MFICIVLISLYLDDGFLNDMLHKNLSFHIFDYYLNNEKNE
jgi:hypothetical protein